MIRYSLHCDKAHDFDSWFQSADAYEAVRKAGHVTCPVCGSGAVEKSLMAPVVRPARNGPEAKPLAAPQNDIEAALAEMRRQVEENSEYVGMNFAAEARAIHEGASPERAIYGETRPDEARALIEDGIPVAPLPFMPARKTN
jgi:hypothetical protein